MPAGNTIRARIQSLDALVVTQKREGSDAARRLRAEAGSTIDARQRLGELADRVVTKLRDLEGITKQTRAIVKAVTSIDSAIAKARAEIVALCADATARQPVGGETP